MWLLLLLLLLWLYLPVPFFVPCPFSPFQENKRKKLLRKIEEEEARTLAMQKAKKDLMEQRKRTAKAVLQKKHELAEQMLELQITKRWKPPKKEKKRKARKVATRRNAKPQTRANTVEDDFDFEAMFSSNFYHA